MNKIATTLLISSLALGGFTIAGADDDRYEKREHSYEKHEHSGKYCNKNGKGSGSRIDRMIERLELNDEQAKQVRIIRDQYAPKFDALGNKMKDSRQKLRELMHADSIDQNQVKKLAQVMGDLKTDKIILRSEIRNDINKVLTMEQREKMKYWKGRRGHDHRYRHHG